MGDFDFSVTRKTWWEIAASDLVNQGGGGIGVRRVIRKNVLRPLLVVEVLSAEGAERCWQRV